MKILGKRKKGFALLTVLALATFLLLVAGAVGSEILMSQAAAKSRISEGRARFAAYAGLQHALQLLKANQDFTILTDGQLMPGSQTVSYTVEITDNRTPNPDNPRAADGSVTAPDDTVVPEGSVYCASMGVENHRGSVSLHALTGHISSQHPTLSYSAFSDRGTQLLGESQSLSFQGGVEEVLGPDGLPAVEAIPGVAIVPDQDGRLAPETTGSLGHLGSNSILDMDQTATISGDLFLPTEQSALVQELQATVNANAGAGDPSTTTEVLPLTVPVDIPKYSRPAASASDNGDPVEEVDQGAGTLSAAPSGGVRTVRSVNVPIGQTLEVPPGRYFVRGDMTVHGNIVPGPGVTADNPIVLYVGGNATIGAPGAAPGTSGQVNLGGKTAGLQLYFVDNGSDTQTMTVTGDSNFFGTVVGNRVEGVFEQNAQLFGGFLGRSVVARDEARFFYDESLATTQLSAAANWGLNGITEPKPRFFLQCYPAARIHVEAVTSGNPNYATSYAMPIRSGGEQG